MNVVEARGLGKRYGSSWALRDCSLAIPAGHVAALVGPNGAGKTTLLNLAVGLAVPSAGGVTVLGGCQPGSPAALDGIGFVAQDTPLYTSLTAADMLHMTGNLNRRFDQAFAESRLAELGIPLQRKAGKLSGGQQAQLALTLALARRPRLLVLDEPVAMLDPIARHDFMAAVLMAAVDDGVSVLLSSHSLPELERVADYLILLSRGRVQVAGDVDDLLAGHRVLTGPAAEADRHAEWPVVHVRRGEAQAHLLVRATATDPVPAGWESHPVGLEELALAYLREPGAAARPGPQPARRGFEGHAMTALTARPGNDASLRPVPWRRMVWVTWRQHRIALTGVAAFLAALAAYVWINGLQLHHAYSAAAACHPATSPACSALSSRIQIGAFLSNGYNLQAVPALIGALIGAPLLARELETGTFRYAWTQGIGRLRWTLGKLVPLAILLTAAAGALSALLTWYYEPYFVARNPALFPREPSPLGAGLFSLRGVAFASWTLAAFAIGALAGMLIRRVVPAIAATLAAYTGLAFAAALYLRPHYLPPLVIRNLPSYFYNPPPATFIVHQWWTRDGTTISQSTMTKLINTAFTRMMPVVHSSKEGAVAAQKPRTNLHVLHYLNQHGYSQWTSYQPASRFWTFQWIEAGWLLGLSLLLISATVWLVHRRAA